VTIVDWELVALAAWQAVETARTHLDLARCLASSHGCDPNLDCLILNVPDLQTVSVHQVASREKVEARTAREIRVGSPQYSHRSYYQADQDCHDIDYHLDFEVFAQMEAVEVAATRCLLELALFPKPADLAVVAAVQAQFPS
jgi:hypothetical protein